MQKRIIQSNGIAVAVIYSHEIIIADAQSALDLIADIDYNDNCQRMAINKGAVTPDFFKLGTGMAGEILQKFANYSKKIAIIGDFSGYASQSLKDFIYECNRGNFAFFVPDEQTAVERLTER
ncbi:MAG: DUF4180 domain-containing protein [Clostridiales bacterium]|jgi:hypothetical protein|nr:DUF4180 domain-containing protein [Clostridiales bacterium]